MSFNRTKMQAVRGWMYPEIPAGWPNRSIRRAVRFRKEHRLSREWRQVLASRPQLRTAILAL